MINSKVKCLKMPATDCGYDCASGCKSGSKVASSGVGCGSSCVYSGESMRVWRVGNLRNSPPPAAYCLTACLMAAQVQTQQTVTQHK